VAVSSLPELREAPAVSTQHEPDALTETSRRIADQVAGPAAVSVDREARFPHEAVDALRSARLLGALVPREFGGLGADLKEIVSITETLARRCAATGMIFAMHQIQVACLTRHVLQQAAFRRYLEELALGQRLIASVTSEVGVGGDLRKSVASVLPGAHAARLEKRAPTVSYGEHADDLLVTARRAPDAAPSDQVLVLLRRGDYALERLSDWNTLGMRGTCSPGFVVRAAFAPDQIVPGDFAEIACQTMVPVSHLLWSAVWLGIASDALSKAHAFVRSEARRQPGSVPPGALRLAEASALLDSLRGRVQAMLVDYQTACESCDGALSGLAWSVKINGLKLSASELVVEIVTRALGIIGMAGYREDGELSVARHLRDAHSAALMINNDRIYAANASLLLVQKESR
jgi:acyl-CoA dehydrogenase